MATEIKAAEQALAHGEINAEEMRWIKTTSDEFRKACEGRQYSEPEKPDLARAREIHRAVMSVWFARAKSFSRFNFDVALAAARTGDAVDVLLALLKAETGEIPSRRE